MDRLSDWLGSFVPGCSRLPPRHPVKVSLVMGGLGFVAGWLTAGIVLILAEAMGQRGEFVSSMIVGAFLGSLVFIPLLVWQSQSVVRCILAIVLAIVAGMFHIWIIDFLTDGPSWPGFTIGGLLGGMGYSLAGLIVIRPRAWWVLIANGLLSASVHWAFAIVLENPNLFTLPSPFDRVVSVVVIANLFSSVFACLGITFGHVLWDWTPRPKFADATSEGPTDD